MALRELLFERLKDKPHPLFVFNDTIIPAATIWIGVRAWVNFFREIGIKSGDRILLAYPESPAFVHILYAAIWEKLTICIIKADNFDLSLVEKLDVRLAINTNNFANVINPCAMGMPPTNLSERLRECQSSNFPDVRFILQSSGTTGNPKFICLTEDGINGIIRSHSLIFETDKIVALSVLPWSHCFGLVLDLFLCTFNSECIVRDPHNGKNIESILSYFKKYEITHFSSVPLTIERILETDRGKSLLTALSSGIIGGAPISKQISHSLVGSNLRVGYGQTEASPGICLGKKGIFYENYIGDELGCKVKLSKSGELFFRGDNSLYGYWESGEVKKVPANTWIPTGDIVEKKENGYFFKGRLDFSFKLPNGILIQPEEIEKQLTTNLGLSRCLLFFNKNISIYFNSPDPELLPDKIQESIPSILKKYSIQINYLSEENWILSPKGEIDRKKMIQKLNID